MSTENQRCWDAKIGERFLNSTPNKTTTKSPYEALHGYQPRFHLGTLSSVSLTRNEWVEPREMHQLVQKNIIDGQQRLKKAYDLKRIDGIKFDIGEVVVMLRQPTLDQPSKLQGKYRERPLQVIEVLPSDTYCVTEIASDGKELYVTTDHVSQLKSWKILREPGDEGEESDEEDQLETERSTTHGALSDEDQPEVEETTTQGKLTEGGSRPTCQQCIPNRFKNVELM